MFLYINIHRLKPYLKCNYLNRAEIENRDQKTTTIHVNTDSNLDSPIQKETLRLKYVLFFTAIIFFLPSLSYNLQCWVYNDDNKIKIIKSVHQYNSLAIIVSQKKKFN